MPALSKALALVASLAIEAAPRGAGARDALSRAAAVHDGAAPFETVGHPITRDARAASRSAPLARTYGGDPMFLAFEVYRRALTTFDGPRCPHRPTCSLYAMQAIHHHGLVLGGWLTVDRLLRGDESSAIRKLPRDAEGHLLDPLPAATFWFDR